MPDINTLFPTASSARTFVTTYSRAAFGSHIVYGDAYQAVYVPAGCSLKTSPTKSLFDRLAQLKTKYSTAFLPGSEAPNARAFHDAREFVLTLPLSRIVEPTIHVASDGEVNFQWSGTDFRIDLGFYGNDKFSFYAAKEGQDPILGDDIPVKQGIPQSVVDFASAV